MKQHLICFSGKKQAGKDTCYQNLEKYFFTHTSIEQFSFADPLKRMCIDILGLTEQQCYGTDEDKNSLVHHLKWQNFPLAAYDMWDGSIYLETPDKMSAYNYWLKEVKPYGFSTIELGGTKLAVPMAKDIFEPEDPSAPKRKIAYMTAREVMQYVGTDIYRRLYNNVWVDATIRRIKNSRCEFAIVTDCRFSNEVESFQKAGGKVIRLTRNPCPGDNHYSETALDPDKFEWSKFDAILDNKDMYKLTQFKELCNILYKLKVIDETTCHKMQANANFCIS